MVSITAVCILISAFSTIAQATVFDLYDFAYIYNINSGTPTWLSFKVRSDEYNYICNANGEDDFQPDAGKVDCGGSWTSPSGTRAWLSFSVMAPPPQFRQKFLSGLDLNENPLQLRLTFSHAFYGDEIETVDVSVPLQGFMQIHKTGTEYLSQQKERDEALTKIRVWL